MSVPLEAYVEDVNDQIAAGYTTVRWYRANSPTGTFTHVASAALVADQLQYTGSDAGGTADSWYGITYYTSVGPTETAMSVPFRSDAFTLFTLRYEAARLARAGSRGICSAAGTSTTLVAKRLGISGKDVGYHEGDWIYRPDAADDDDKVRRIAEGGFTVATGTLTIPDVWPWAVPPTEGEAFQIFQWFPPIDVDGEQYCWDDVVREGLADTWFPDQINIGAGTSTAKTRFSLEQFGPLVGGRKHIYRVWFRQVDATTGFNTDRLFGKNGSYYGIIENGPGDLSIDLSSAPGTQDFVILDVKRRFGPVYANSDIVEGPIQLAIAACARQALIKAGITGPRFTDVDATYRREQGILGTKRGGVLM